MAYFLYHLTLSEKYQNPSAWTPETQATIGEHAALLHRLGQSGHLICAGPTDFPPGHPRLFGIAILLAESLEQAQALVAKDAAVLAGIQVAEVLPLRLPIRYFGNEERAT